MEQVPWKYKLKQISNLMLKRMVFIIVWRRGEVDYGVVSVVNPDLKGSFLWNIDSTGIKVKRISSGSIEDYSVVLIIVG